MNGISLSRDVSCICCSFKRLEEECVSVGLNDNEQTRLMALGVSKYKHLNVTGRFIYLNACLY